MKNCRLSLGLAALLALPALSLVACGDDSSSSGGSGGDASTSATTTSGGDGGAGSTTSQTGATTSTGDTTSSAGGAGGEAPVGPVCTDPTAVPCEDDVILQMNLKDTPAPGAIDNEPDGTGFHSTVDATAGGAFVPDPDSYVYARFTETGLEKVEISDEESLTSMDWDIAFRRYVIRINSGNSGPSCVGATRVPGAGDYESTTGAPEGATFHTDDYFTDTCEIIADGTGLPGSPATALSSYWTYPGCVQMTNYVFVVQLADARLVKLTVTNYYNDAAQAQCQTDDVAPEGNNGSATIQLRWAFL